MNIGVMQAKTTATLDLAYQCHHDWFAMAGYIPANPTGRYTDEFTARSDYFLAYEKNGGSPSRQNTVGLVRVVRQKPYRTFEDFELFPDFDYLPTMPDSLCCELSALCWSPNHARSGAMHVFRALRYYHLKYGREFAVCNLDNRVIAFLRRMHTPMTVCGESQYYMGSEKTPILFEAAQVEFCLAYDNPPLWDIINTPLEG